MQINISCISNDIPYPVISLQILTFEVEGQEGSTIIDKVTRTVTVPLKETINLKEVVVKQCKVTEGVEAPLDSATVIDLSSPKKYTISFEIKPSVDTKFTISFRNGDGTNIFTNEQTTKVAPKNVWTKLYVTLTTIATFPTMSAQVMYMTGASCAANVSYILRNLVIEEGTKPSPWTPAPEDTQSQIDNITEITTSHTTSISTMKGQISSLISEDTTIKGNYDALLSRYNATVATVDSMKTTIGEHTTILNNQNDSITASHNES